MRNRRPYFNQAARNWDEEYNNPKLQAFLKQFVLLFGLGTGQNVLDVGTGTGILISLLYEAVTSKGHITAIDYSKNMINICKKKYAHLPNVTIMEGNAEKLQFPDRFFDVVTCFGVFPHLDNKGKSLTQFRRVLKPGGKLIIAHALSSNEIKSHHENAPAVAADLLPSETEMRKLLQKAGFSEIEIVDKPGRYLCTSRRYD